MISSLWASILLSTLKKQTTREEKEPSLRYDHSVMNEYGESLRCDHSVIDSRKRVQRRPLQSFNHVFRSLERTERTLSCWLACASVGVKPGNMQDRQPAAFSHIYHEWDPACVVIDCSVFWIKLVVIRTMKSLKAAKQSLPSEASGESGWITVGRSLFAQRGRNGEKRYDICCRLILKDTMHS